MLTGEQLRNLQGLYDEIPNYDGRARAMIWLRRTGFHALCASGMPHYGHATPTLLLALDRAVQDRPFRNGGLCRGLFGRTLLPMGQKRQDQILSRHYGLDSLSIEAIRAIDLAAGPSWHHWCRRMLECLGTLIDAERGPDAGVHCNADRDFGRDELGGWRVTESNVQSLADLRAMMEFFPPVWLHVTNHLPEFLSVGHLIALEGVRAGVLPTADVARRLAIVQFRREQYGLSNRGLERLETIQREYGIDARRAIAELDRIIADATSPPEPEQGFRNNMLPPSVLEVSVPDRTRTEPVAAGAPENNRRVRVRTTDRTNGQ